MRWLIYKVQLCLSKRKAQIQSYLELAQCIVRAFILQLYILQYTMIVLADREGHDQTARMRRLIWAFAVRIWPKAGFRMLRPIYKVQFINEDINKLTPSQYKYQ